jgi:micrococcal nuclease
MPVIDLQIPTVSIEAIYITDSDGGEVALKFRLVGCDSPETGQPYYQKSIDFLFLLMQTTDNVAAIPTGADKYGRLLLRIFRNHVDIAKIMVEKGMAWNTGNFHTEELEAKNAKRGLWKSNNPIPPWEWRKTHGRDGKKK